MSATSATILMAQYYEQATSTRDINHSMMSYNATTMGEMTKGDDFSTSTSASQTRYQLTTVDEVILVLHGLIFILAVVGNGLVIVTLAQNRRMRTVTNIFLLNLAVSDLLLAIFCMPFTILPVIMKDFVFGRVMCVLIRYLQGMSVSASAFTLVAISLERFYAICNPLKSRKWQHLKHSYKVLAGVWSLAMVINIPFALFQTIVTYPSGSRMCADMWPNIKAQQSFYFLHLAIADLLLPLIIMSVAYSLIAKTLWNGLKMAQLTDTSLLAKAKRQTSLTSDGSDISDECEMNESNPLSTNNNNGRMNFVTHRSYSKPPSLGRQETHTSLRSHSSASNIKSKRRVIRMLFVIVLEFFICWTPLYVVYLWIILDRQSAKQHLPSPKVLLSLLRLLAYTSSCCNPITYCFMSKKFRTAFLTAFKCARKPKLLNRRPTIQSTQISYCDNNGHHHHHPQLQHQNSSSKSKCLQSAPSSGSFHVSKLPLAPLSERENSMKETELS